MALNQEDDLRRREVQTVRGDVPGDLLALGTISVPGSLVPLCGQPRFEG